MVNPLKWTTVDSKEVEQSRYRLEASVFNIEAKAAKKIIEKCKYSTIPLIGNDGFVKRAHYGGRLKRKYIPKSNPDAIGFLGSSEMLQINPIPEKFFSNKYENISQLKVKKGSILISRSGTIGNLTIVNNTLSKHLVSEHAIRMEDVDYPGYVYSFLKTDVGQRMILSNVYGAVVNQIEPEHLASILVPNPEVFKKEDIHNKIMHSFALRDESNVLLEKADKLLIDALNLPPIEQIREDNFKEDVGVRNYSVPLNFLDGRFDASYHYSVVSSIIDTLLDNACKVQILGDIATKITKPNIFKRIYVGEKEGILFLGNKDFLELSPNSEKYLSRNNRKMREIYSKELNLKENNILVSCRGTIGNVGLIPKHFESFAISDNIIKLTLPDNVAGYIYVYLNSDFGNVLIKRETYGSVIDVVDPVNLAKIPVPILRDEMLMTQINNLALKANKLRSEAYYLEQEAIKQVNEEVIYS